jgi:hypothetical protein
MLGNLDQPPLTIRRSRVKAMLMVVLCIAAVAGGAVIWSDPAQRHSWVWAVAFIIIFAPACPFYAWEVIRPDQLVLSPLGLRLEGTWKSWSYRWDEVSGFRASLVDGRVKIIEFDIHHPSGTILSSIARNAVGTHGTLNGLWELGQDKLAAVLNEARSRWGENNPPAAA